MYLSQHFTRMLYPVLCRFSSLEKKGPVSWKEALYLLFLCPTTPFLLCYQHRIRTSPWKMNPTLSVPCKKHPAAFMCTLVVPLLYLLSPSPSQTEDLRPLSKAHSHQKRKTCPWNDSFFFFLSGEGNPGIFVIFIFNFTTVIFFSTVGFILG